MRIGTTYFSVSLPWLRTKLRYRPLILLDGTIRLSEDDFQRISHKTGGIPLPDGSGFMATMSVFHQLHCLVRQPICKRIRLQVPNTGVFRNAFTRVSIPNITGLILIQKNDTKILVIVVSTPHCLIKRLTSNIEILRTLPGCSCKAQPVTVLH